jgi:hypothetical protein
MFFVCHCQEPSSLKRLGFVLPGNRPKLLVNCELLLAAGRAAANAKECFNQAMDNRSIARLLEETASLLEISAGDPFRVRSYQRAAEAVEASTVQLSEIAGEEPT